MNITHDMSNDLTEYDPESRQVDGPNPIENRISSSAARVPDIISCTSGITVQGRQLHSFAFTTDAAIIRNTNADAILAVYPFTGEPVITQALLTAAQAPLFVGVGGGTTTGPRVIQLAMMAEMQGAAGVVLNAPAPPSTVYDVARITNTPVIATVLTCDDELDEKIEAGASIINVAETALQAVPREYEEASLALGATETETYFRVSLHAARSGVATAVVLGVGRAIGEAMAIIMVAGNVSNMPGLFTPVRFLTTGIVSGMAYARVGSLYHQALYSIALVLFLFIMLINVFLNVCVKRRKEG